jgi:hypothetical protein
MSMNEGMNIVNNALNLALGDLESRGMPEDEAQIALLVRLLSVVPKDVSDIAGILHEDPEFVTAINGPSNHPAAVTETA